MGREFEVVVFGATGFTGQLTAEYLLKTYGASGDSLRWAIAGRTQSKLDKVKATIGKLVGDAEGAEKIETIIADSADGASLDAMCARTDVVVSTVGPFIRYGTPLVQACIKNGTDYCDSTGETTWIRRMIDMFQEQAEEAGVRLVPSCGYDSLPSDLGAMTLVEAVRADDPDAKIKQVMHYIGPMRGGPSGGTLHTAMNIISGEDKKLLFDVYTDPYALVPRGSAGKDSGDQRFVSFSKTGSVYTAPFFMAAGNERIVRRSATLRAAEYGPSFRFLEVMAFSSPFKALLVALAINFSMVMAIIPPIRWLLERYVLPAPGTGPSRKSMEKGFGLSTMHAVVDKTHYVVNVNISAGDVGYKSTSMMLAESAIALAHSKGEGEARGFLTPATCPGMQSELAATLSSKCGISFELSRTDSSKEARKLIRTVDSKL